MPQPKPLSFCKPAVLLASLVLLAPLLMPACHRPLHEERPNVPAPKPAPASQHASTRPIHPVSLARNGFTPEQVAAFHAEWNWRDLFTPDDLGLYACLHFSEFYPTAIIRRQGPVVALETALDPQIPRTRLSAEATATRLDDFLTSEKSRAQAMIVVHQGKIVFETYPGMRDTDAHLTMSVGKTMPSLVISLLEEEGRIDVEHAIGQYIPALANSAWSDIKVIDVLNMASGLDIAESGASRDDPHAAFGRELLATFNIPGPDGRVEHQTDVIRSVKKAREPGTRFEYSSMNTEVLVLLAEAIEHRPWPEIFESRVWSRLTPEGDILVMITPEGTAMAAGLTTIRLRDLARFGLLYTPSWNKAAREPIVSPAVLRKIQAWRSPTRMAGSEKTGLIPARNSRQWDYVWDDGDIYKSGLHNQGLYVSPSRDVVIAWFATAPGGTELLQYARTIARSYSNGSAR